MNRKQAANLINCAYIALLAAGTVIPLLRADKREKQRGVRTLEAIGGSLLLVNVLKHAVPEKRPDGTDDVSFPSEHTAYAFVIAVIAASFARKQSPLWYGMASLIGVARVALRRHHLRDVLTGALVGTGMAHCELACKEGWVTPALKALSDKI